MQGSAHLVDGVITHKYYYTPEGQLIAVSDKDGNLKKSFIYATKSHVPDYFVDEFNKRFKIVTDQLGSVRLIVNAESGEVIQKMNHDEFGNVLFDSNPMLTPFGFAGGLYDSKTGIVRFGARDYDPKVGRWTSKDPIRFDGGDSNLYGYVLQDPVDAIDPMGTTIINLGVFVPSQVLNSKIYKVLDQDSKIDVFLSSFKNSNYFGLTTGNFVQINIEKHNGNYEELIDTYIDELSHVFGNNYYRNPTSEHFDHEILKPEFLNEPSIKKNLKCGDR